MPLGSIDAAHVAQYIAEELGDYENEFGLTIADPEAHGDSEVAVDVDVEDGRSYRVLVALTKTRTVPSLSGESRRSLGSRYWLY